MAPRPTIRDLPFYKATIDASHNGIVIIDKNGLVIFDNKAAKKISGSEDRQHVGKHIKEIHPEFWDDFHKILMTGIPQIQKKIHVDKKTLLVNRTPIVLENKIVGVVSVFEDITKWELQLKKSERLTKEYKSKLKKIQKRLNRIDDCIAVSKQMKNVVELALRVARIDIPVLIQGETGVGKEVIARLIHKKSRRSKKGTLMKINCAAIPGTLLESELFGYEKGAFSGANQLGKKGLFELSEGGTVFLDDIETLSLNLQVKLLSTVQDLEIRRIGGVKPIKIDTRIIAASNRDLYQLAQNGTFREDLFFRLNVVPINIPPLRERKEDIPHLINYFLKRDNAKYKKNSRFADSVMEHFMNYDWRGNVRELENVIAYLSVVSPDDEITVEHLPPAIKAFKQVNLSDLDIPIYSSLKESVLEFESRLIHRAIGKCGNARRAAKLLDVDPSTITRKLKRFNHLVDKK